jgi:hypothetical protein
VRPSVSAASPGLPNARPQTKIANDQHPAFG